MTKISRIFFPNWTTFRTLTIFSQIIKKKNSECLPKMKRRKQNQENKENASKKSRLLKKIVYECEATITAKKDKEWKTKI